MKEAACLEVQRAEGSGGWMGKWGSILREKGKEGEEDLDWRSFTE